MKAINQKPQTTLLILVLLLASLSLSTSAFSQNYSETINADDLICTNDLDNPFCDSAPTSSSGGSGSGSSGTGQRDNVQSGSESQYVRMTFTGPWARYIFDNQNNDKLPTLVPVDRYTDSRTGEIYELRRWTSAINGSNSDGSHLVVTLGPGRWVKVGGPQAHAMPTATQITEYTKQVWRYHNANYRWQVYMRDKVMPYQHDVRYCQWVNQQIAQYNQATQYNTQEIQKLDSWIKIGSPQ